MKIYGERAHRLKEVFLRHGFHLVYDNDLGDPVADGFYLSLIHIYNIMEERITSMIPRYGKLNKIYTGIMSGDSFSFEKQQFLSLIHISLLR